jgi:phospholipase C
MSYFKRQDIPTHWDVADGYTIADMYTESILAATDPNRISWMSGTVNNPGTPSNPDGSGGMMLDNSKCLRTGDTAGMDAYEKYRRYTWLRDAAC